MSWVCLICPPGYFQGFTTYNYGGGGGFSTGYSTGLGGGGGGGMKHGEKMFILCQVQSVNKVNNSFWFMIEDEYELKSQFSSSFYLK